MLHTRLPRTCADACAALLHRQRRLTVTTLARWALAAAFNVVGFAAFLAVAWRSWQLPLRHVHVVFSWGAFQSGSRREPWVHDGIGTMVPFWIAAGVLPWLLVRRRRAEPCVTSSVGASPYRTPALAAPRRWVTHDGAPDRRALLAAAGATGLVLHALWQGVGYDFTALTPVLNGTSLVDLAVAALVVGAYAARVPRRSEPMYALRGG